MHLERREVEVVERGRGSVAERRRREVEVAVHWRSLPTNVAYLSLSLPPLAYLSARLLSATLPLSGA
jgi:hypothetical protein